MAVVSFDNYVKGIGQGDAITADTVDDAKHMVNSMYGKFSCSVVIKENKAEYPKLDWVTVESYKINK